MTIKKIEFASTSALEAIMSGFETTANGIVNQRGNSLFSCLADFLSVNTKARSCQSDVQLAEELAAVLPVQLCAYLKKCGFDAQLLLCRGAKFKLDGCSPFLEGMIREIGTQTIGNDLVHFVVCCGNAVIDLAYMRLGSNYLNSNNCVRAQLDRCWAEVNAVPDEVACDGRRFLVYVRSYIADNTKLGSIMRSGKSSSGFVPALASASGFEATAMDVVRAFKGARRNRRIRATA